MRKHSSRGFTLIEMLVSLALFSIVVLVAVGALLALVGANKKAQALESVMENLNVSIDDMVRNAREGTDYNGSLACTENTDGEPDDCTNGGTEFEFEPYGGNSSDLWVYKFVPPGTKGDDPLCASGGCIERSESGTGGPFTSITAPEVSITSMDFYVVGTTPGDTLQPKVVIVIEGTAGATDVRASTTFHIQATAVQRVLDI